MPKPREFRGQEASAGLVQGKIWLAPGSDSAAYVPKETVEAERTALTDAIAAAAQDVAALMADADEDAAAILEFQIAMLEDDALTAGAFEAIASGKPADESWTDALKSEIETYKSAEDEYFRARSADLEDIRDRVLARLRGVETRTMPSESIYVGDDITPSQFLSSDWSGGGIALREGSRTGHVAMLARARGVPAIVGIGHDELDNGSTALLDASDGRLIVHPGERELKAFQSAIAIAESKKRIAADFAPRPAETRDGSPITVFVNISHPDETDTVPISHVDGVGLMRTEFLFDRHLPDESEQFEAYAKILRWAQGKPVTIRTVDAGGDKPVPGFTEMEANPFLGLRGIRLSLAKPEIFRVQIRALLRAAALGNLRVMLPMVAIPSELDEAVKLFSEEAERLSFSGVTVALPEIGIMVEVPSVAITPQRFETAAFFSIGSNDLTQYALAASRDNGRLAYLARPDDPAVLSLMANVAAYGTSAGKSVSLCGDAASEAALIPGLLACAIRAFSVVPSRIGVIKAAIAACDLRRAA